MSQKKKFHAYISGRVQGVFFRWSTKKLAKKIEINGYVKNLQDGRVEVVAEGEEEKLKELIKFLQKGPKHARVHEVDVSWENYKDEYSSFQIAH
jgi:acylphosphatase